MSRQTITSGIKIGSTAIVLLLILGYAYARVESFVQGPRITIITPQNGETIPVRHYQIEGIIERAAYITLNGRQIYTDESGKFSEEVLFAEHLNIFEIVATDRFERKTKEVLQIIYKP